MASINPSRITDQGSKKRVRPYVINIICLASDSTLDGSCVSPQRAADLFKSVRLLAYERFHWIHNPLTVIKRTSLKGYWIRLPLHLRAFDYSSSTSSIKVLAHIFASRGKFRHSRYFAYHFSGGIPRARAEIESRGANEPLDWIL